MTCKKIKVLVLQKFLPFKRKLEKALSGVENLILGGALYSTGKAIDFIKTTPPDIIVIDIELAEKDRTETMRIVNEINDNNRNKAIGIIVIGTTGSDIDEVSRKEIERGASDILFAPVTNDNANLFIKKQLLSKINSFIAIRNISDRRNASKERRHRKSRIKAIAIGVSTGGPNALHEMVPQLCSKTKVPVFIVQHMPPLFTKTLAEKLNQKTCSTVIEASEGKVKEGHVYIAPGGRHMTIEKNSNEIEIRISDELPINSCKPSVDALFHSVAKCYGENTIAVILTGMGKDGTAGLASLKKAGAYVIAQDQKTSVVWGMPGSAVKSGHVDEILPLHQISDRIGHIININSKVAEENIQCRN